MLKNYALRKKQYSKYQELDWYLKYCQIDHFKKSYKEFTLNQFPQINMREEKIVKIIKKLKN